MNTETIIKNEITISAPATLVWDALTNPVQTEKYMFGCKIISDWKVGSPVLWTGPVIRDKDEVILKGNLVDIKAGELLVYTEIDPKNSLVKDIPENYLTVTYKLVEENKRTRLTVTVGDYAKVADGESRYKDAHQNGEGWKPVLAQIKRMLEPKVSLSEMFAPIQQKELITN